MRRIVAGTPKRVRFEAPEQEIAWALHNLRQAQLAQPLPPTPQTPRSTPFTNGGALHSTSSGPIHVA